MHSKGIMPRVDNKRSNFYIFQRTTQDWLYGFSLHDAFNKHLFNLKISSEGRCKLCKDKKEISRHLLKECEFEALAARRYTLLGKSEIELTDLVNFYLKDLMKLLL